MAVPMEETVAIIAEININVIKFLIISTLKGLVAAGE